MTDLDVKGLVERLLDGVRECGLHDDNETELFDIEGGNEVMAEAATALISLSEKVEGLEKEVGHWKANHAEMVQRNAVLRERPDLPVDRLPAIARYERQLQDARLQVIASDGQAQEAYEAHVAAEERVQKLEEAISEFGSSRVRDRVAKAVGCNADLLHEALQAEVREALKEQP